MTFVEQLQTVQGAATLAGITGSDLVTGVFLPKGAAVVEIFPSLRDHQVVNVEVCCRLSPSCRRVLLHHMHATCAKSSARDDMTRESARKRQQFAKCQLYTETQQKNGSQLIVDAQCICR